MIARTRGAAFTALLLALGPGLNGCGGQAEPQSASKRDEPKASAPSRAVGTPVVADSSRRKPTLKPVALGAAGESGGSDRSVPVATSGPKADAVMEALRPLQVLIGSWRGITFKEIGGAKAIEEPQWIWDLRSNPEQPALLMESRTSPYFKSARITFLVDKQMYQLTATDREGRERVYEGEFTQPVEDVPGDGGRLQRTYKLEFVQVQPGERRNLAKIVVHQQDNDRYLMGVFEQRGPRLARYDTVGNQRQGTSLALSHSDFGERTCVVSQGLGTIAVSHDGRTYYVCCTGCQAAFQEEPERWIARLAERKQ